MQEKKKGAWRTWLYLPLGAIAALPTVFSGLSALAFFAFVPALYLLFCELMRVGGEVRMRHFYRVGLAFSMGYFTVVFHWFTYLYPLDFITGMTPLVALIIVVLACIGLPLLQSLGFALLFLGMGYAAKTRACERHKAILLPLLFAAGWTVYAFTQTLTFAGVPWGAQLALSQTSRVFLSSASFFGSYFVTFIIAATNAYFAMAVLHLFHRDGRRAGRLALLACAIFLGNALLGTVSYCLPLKTGESIKVAVLQGNFASAEKWDENTDAIAKYRELALAAAEEGATLMVWPETAITKDFREGSIARIRVSNIAKETGTYQLVGAYHHETKDGVTYRHNSIYLIYPDGSVSENIYHKQHLVPFGEYVPLEGFIRAVFPPLANLEMLQDGSTLTPGKSPAIFDEEMGKIGALVCFDTIYESLARSSVAAGAELIAIGTNDSWFFDSAAVHMHNRQAILRAIENRRYVLRAANTGVSSIISPTGEELAHIDPLVEGYAVAEVSFVSSRTLYSYIGDSFVLLCQAAVLAPFVYDLVLYFKKKKAE